MIFDAARPVILNGIEELATRSDLLDRTIVVEAAMITETTRREKDEFWAAFEEACPSILGALLKAVSTALRGWSTTKLTRRPRMADFARWVTAAEPAFAWEEGTFLAAYFRNRDAANRRAVEVDVVAGAVQTLLRTTPTWAGTATDLLNALTFQEGDNAHRLPAASHVLSGRLRRIAPNLRKRGIEVEFREEGHDSRKMIHIQAAEASDGSAGSDGDTRDPAA